jgi:hypothetical protein
VLISSSPTLICLIDSRESFKTQIRHHITDFEPSSLILPETVWHALVMLVHPECVSIFTLVTRTHGLVICVITSLTPLLDYDLPQGRDLYLICFCISSIWKHLWGYHVCQLSTLVASKHSIEYDLNGVPRVAQHGCSGYIVDFSTYLLNE